MNYFRRIVIFILIVNIIFEFVPNESYKKYIKHISGIIMVLIIINPISKYCNINILENSVSNFFMQNAMLDVNKFMSDSNDMALNNSVAIYRSNFENQIKSYLTDCNFDVTDVQAGISITNENEIRIDYVEIDLKFINYEIENEYIKNMVEEKFFISKEIINVV